MAFDSDGSLFVALADRNQRIVNVRMGPDGHLYVLT